MVSMCRALVLLVGNNLPHSSIAQTLDVVVPPADIKVYYKNFFSTQHLLKDLSLPSRSPRRWSWSSCSEPPSPYSCGDDWPSCSGKISPPSLTH